jgi:SAM-dependent methyltransferase
MATQPDGEPERAPAAREPHQCRAVAQSFGSDPARYDRARPSYPDAVVRRIVAASPGPDLVDVGCGTGIAARQFQAAGCRVLGVEPDPRVAGLARQSGIEVEVTTFEAWDPAGREFDAVIAAQAWHWVDPVAGAVKAARALRARGRLAVFWNALRLPPDLSEAFAGVYHRVQPGLPFNPCARPLLDSYLMMCAKAADGIRQAGRFGEPEQWGFDWDRRYTRAEWLDQVQTFGGHSQIRPAKLHDLLAGIGAAIDAVGGGFTADYTTLAVAAARAGG